MLNLGPHAGIIIAAYAVAFVALGTLTLFIVTDDRRQRRILRDMERRGIRRRSAPKPPVPIVTKSKAAKPKASKTPARRKPNATRKARS